MKFLKSLFAALTVLCAVFISVDGMAADEMYDDGTHVEIGNIKSDPLVKLGRGFANIIFGPLELLKHPYKVGKENGGIAGITYGVLKGMVQTLKREGVGIVEILTFPIPLPGAQDDPRQPGWGYGPLMRPAWVFSIEDNAYNFFYDNGSMKN